MTLAKYNPADVQKGEGDADKGLASQLGDLGTLKICAYNARREEVPLIPRTAPRKRSSKPKADRIAAHKQPDPAIANGIVSEKTFKGRSITHQAT
jgi:hypothetical protein